MVTIQSQKFVHYDNIDVAKVVFAIFVVGIHTLSPFTTTLSPVAQRVITTLLSMAVPFFFVASGFLLGKKLNSTNRKGEQVYLRKWLYRIGRLYLFWNLIYLPYAIYGFCVEDISIGKSIIIYARNILLVGENYWSWPLWYLLGMLVSGCMIWILIQLNIKRIYWYLCAIFFAIIGILIDELHTHGWEAVNAYYSIFKTTRNGFFIGFPYMTLGLLVSSYDRRLSQTKLFVLLWFNDFS